MGAAAPDPSIPWLDPRYPLERRRDHRRATLELYVLREMGSLRRFVVGVLPYVDGVLLFLVWVSLQGAFGPLDPYAIGGFQFVVVGLSTLAGTTALVLLYLRQAHRCGGLLDRPVRFLENYRTRSEAARARLIESTAATPEDLRRRRVALLNRVPSHRRVDAAFVAMFVGIMFTMIGPALWIQWPPDQHPGSVGAASVLLPVAGFMLTFVAMGAFAVLQFRAEVEVFEFELTAAEAIPGPD
jgi:hypothetical protein